MARVGKDGWIKHSGAAACPAGGKWTILDMKYRSGSVHCGVDVSQWLPKEWKHTNHQDDIVSWRPSKLSGSEKSVTENVDAFNSFEMQIGQVDGPLAWRDRIFEIDAEVERLKEERLALVQKLEDEGFALIKEKDELRAGARTSEHEADMSDPGNWNSWDRIECVKTESESAFVSGQIYDVLAVSSCSGTVYVFEDEQGDLNACGTGNFRWHSRPSA